MREGGYVPENQEHFTPRSSVHHETGRALEDELGAPESRRSKLREFLTESAKDPKTLTEGIDATTLHKVADVLMREKTSFSGAGVVRMNPDVRYAPLSAIEHADDAALEHAPELKALRDFLPYFQRRMREMGERYGVELSPPRTDATIIGFAKKTPEATLFGGFHAPLSEQGYKVFDGILQENLPLQEGNDVGPEYRAIDLLRSYAHDAVHAAEFKMLFRQSHNVPKLLATIDRKRAVAKLSPEEYETLDAAQEALDQARRGLADAGETRDDARIAQAKKSVDDADDALMGALASMADAAEPKEGGSVEERTAALGRVRAINSLKNAHALLSNLHDSIAESGDVDLVQYASAFRRKETQAEIGDAVYDANPGRLSLGFALMEHGTDAIAREMIMDYLREKNGGDGFPDRPKTSLELAMEKDLRTARVEPEDLSADIAKTEMSKRIVDYGVDVTMPTEHVLSRLGPLREEAEQALREALFTGKLTRMQDLRPRMSELPEADRDDLLSLAATGALSLRPLFGGEEVATRRKTMAEERQRKEAAFRARRKEEREARERKKKEDADSSMNSSA